MANNDDELLEVHLKKRFLELEKLPAKDRRRIICFGTLLAEAERLIETATSIARNPFPLSYAIQGLISSKDVEEDQDKISRGHAISEGLVTPTLQELRYIDSACQLYLFLE